MFLVSGRSKGLLREIQANLTLYIGVTIGGMSMGYSAIAMPDIQREQEDWTSNSTALFSPILADKEALSWFASFVNLGQFVGGVLGGMLAGMFGPKRTMMLASLPITVGWLTIALAPNIYLLILGRFITGAGTACVSANCSMLVAQYSSTARRGIFLSLFTLMVSNGILIIYCSGALLQWRVVVAVPTTFALVFFIGLLLLPESPIWLLGHKGIEETRAALQWLRGDADVEKELEELRLTQDKMDSKLSLVDALKNFKRRDVHKPVLLVLFNMIFVMLSGPFAIVFYAVNIFKSSGVSIDNHLAAIIMALTRVFTGACAIFFIHKIPRVRLAFCSMLVMGVSMGVLGFTLYCKHVEYMFPGVNIIPLICVFMYMAAFGAGAGPLQWVWMGELVPPEYKVFSGVITSIGTMSIFLITKLFPNLISVLLLHGTFWLFSAICVMTCILYFFFFPETKDLSMLQIRRMFLGETENQELESNDDKNKKTSAHESA